ncbi:MAG TPA: class I SAM-dependent methyltransferase [Acidimicrobiales bacterium]|nr:class I SAM-dependent methyltransferase [Acidimicrobiales bacterium]
MSARHHNRARRRPDGPRRTSERAARRRRNLAFARRDALVQARLQDLAPDALVVDVGSGRLRRAGWVGSRRYVCTDIRPFANVDLLADGTALPFASRSADAVLLLEVLEHVARPRELLAEARRVLKPGGTVVVSVPSTVPRHEEDDYWRFTAQGLGQLCAGLFPEGEVHAFGGTFETLAFLVSYYLALGAGRAAVPVRRLQIALMSIGQWLDSHNQWSSSTTRLHTLHLDVLFVGHPADCSGDAVAGPDAESAPAAEDAGNLAGRQEHGSGAGKHHAQ